MRRVGQITSSNTTSFKFGVACSILTEKLNSSGQRTFFRIEGKGVEVGLMVCKIKRNLLNRPLQQNSLL